MWENEIWYCLVNDLDFVYMYFLYMIKNKGFFFNNYLLFGMCFGLFIVYLIYI